MIDQARNLIRESLSGAQPACLTCSFQAECMVVLHLVLEQHPEIPVLFLDTGYHFPETYAYRDRMGAAWNLNLVNLQPRQTVAEQETQFGILYQSVPDRCCGLRKVEPLFAALEGYGVWFTGLRREQSPTRASLQPDDAFRLPSGKQLRKISPLALWRNREVWATSNSIRSRCYRCMSGAIPVLAVSPAPVFRRARKISVPAVGAGTSWNAVFILEPPRSKRWRPYSDS